MEGEEIDYSLRETRPNIGGDRVSGKKNLASSFDLVEQMKFLFVRIVRARDLPLETPNGIMNPYVEIKIGNYRATTKYFEKKPDSEWNQVFSFAVYRLQGTTMEINVINEDVIGKITISLHDVPTCLPPDSPLASQWYKLEDNNGVNVGKGELMLAIWYSTQADRVFSKAWHSDSATVSGKSLSNTHSKVYLSPKLWYLRVNVIQAQDLVLGHKGRNPEVYVKSVVGDVILRTRVSPDKNVNPKWNEDLMFVVAEPFVDPLIITVEDRLENNTIRHLGKCVIHLSDVDQRLLPLPADPKWYNLEDVFEDGVRKKDNFFSKLNMRVSLDGGYHVYDESVHFGSDYRPTAKALWTTMIGVLELGIINATGLQPMKVRDGRETTDAYCVAKYGPKWVKTRTVVDSFDPKWNEQYTWDVYDPYTMLTIGIFDDCHLHDSDVAGDGKDPSIGKVKIRLSTLEKNKIYTYSFPLLVLQPNGVKRTGEIQLAVRFTCTSYFNLFLIYTMNPLLPPMHHIYPLSIYQVDNLRKQAIHILCSSLSRTEPPLRSEVVEYMLNGGSTTYSLRKAKANFSRILATLKCLSDARKWFDEIRKWENPTATVAVIAIYCIIVLKPDLILPAVILYSVQAMIFQWWKRPMHPTHIEQSLPVTADELDEEFDTFPSSRQSDVLRMRYDRLRSIAGRVVGVIGDIATLAERFHSLLNWRDPRITPIFLVCCVVGSLMLYCVISLEVFLIFVGVYAMRPPLLGKDVLNAPQNFFSRLPTKADYTL
ncbi:multiple C2 and transmembrane domain-containing protein 1-like [Hibiscus syriacus]|uniref:Multiple C2 and transmembrane domain-containing protein 1-like n=1 Tax=Hibiscus syriacus TaxID=106335 RepID=A0A6A2XVX0_HIBSY|nr:FT-interacting protein 3-like [Hibiscus syriacus]KAE8662569.1 multiple C2 and transmembrane domain-containing protein 1-like [Hibiscus syriacus]